jgi:hypothetical protein
MIQSKAASLSAVIAVLAFAQYGQAQTNLLPVRFDAVCSSSSSNSTGILQERVRNINLIDDCAVEHGLTNLSNLSLVFNVTNFSLEVVDSNGVALCTSLAFSGGLTLTNTKSMTHGGSNITTQIVFQRDVTVGTNGATSGVIAGSATWKNADLSSFKLTGNLLYIEPASGTNEAEICRAVLSVGGKQEGEGHGPGRGDDEGSNDNQSAGQNLHNPPGRH